MKPGTKPQCLAEFIFDNGTIGIGTVISTNVVCNQTMPRVHAIRLSLQHMWEAKPKHLSMLPTRFWFDFTAGSVLTPAMYEYLRYPVLTPGRSPKDTCSFPVPHVYFFYAYIGSIPSLLTQFSKMSSKYGQQSTKCFPGATIRPPFTQA